MEHYFAYALQFAGVHGFVLAALLFFRRQKGKAQPIMAAWIFLISVDLVLSGLQILKVYLNQPHWIGLQYGWPYLHGPFLFLYVKYLIPRRVKSATDWLHFLPFLAIKIYLVPFYLQTGAEKIVSYQNFLHAPPDGAKVISLLLPWHGIVYTILALRFAGQYRKIAVEYAMLHSKVHLRWLVSILVFNIAIWVVALIGNLLKFPGLNLIVYSLAALAIFAIGYFGFNEPWLFTSNAEISGSPGAKETGKKYAKTLLNPEKQRQIRDQILAHLDAGAWREAQLSIQDLAHAIGSPIHHVSQVINTEFNANFFTFINSYRLAEAKKFLQDPDAEPMTILEIAYRSGFNSKPSFNTLFKAETGFTPTEFRRNFAKPPVYTGKNANQ